MKVENRLGKGLSAFFDNKKSEMPVFDAQGSAPDKQLANDGATYIPIGNIKPNPNQPRRNFSGEQIRELAASIEKNGVLQPILVRRTGGNMFEIVAGERRWRAAQLANVYEIPAIIKNFTDKQSFEIGLIENLQRENLSPIEEANGYKKLIADFDYTQEAISKLVNKSRSYVGNMLRLLTLPDEIQKMVDEGDISYTIARTLVGSKNPTKEAKEIVKRNLNARQAEKIQGHKKHGNPKEEDGDYIASEIESLKDALRKCLGNDVDIKFKNNKGEILIKFSSLSELDSIVTKLNKI
jgi:ParB family chromosome partitioning protein